MGVCYEYQRRNSQYYGRKMKIRLISTEKVDVQEYEAETIFIKPGVKIHWLGESYGFGQVTVCMDEELANYEMYIDGSDLWIGRKDA